MPLNVDYAASSRVLIPEGEHVIRLVSIERRRMDSQYSKDPDGKVDRFLWRFETLDGSYSYVVFTGTIYGPANAGLTRLLSTMLPKHTPAQIRSMDLESLKGSTYRVFIKHNATATGKQVAQHLFLVPCEVNETETSSGEQDPFADEDIDVNA